MLLLEDRPADLGAEGLPLLVASNGAPIKCGRFEPAGFSFHAVALRLRGLYEAAADGSSSSSDEDDGKKSSGFQDSAYHYSKSKKKSDQQDHYALLGLGHLRFLATEEQIRKAYREVALKHHPDKLAALILLEETAEAKESKKVEIDCHFKAIQEAYEVLVDSAKRRVYDSIDEFDDDIPTECAAEDFFKVFGPAFMRNARWSVVQPSPGLGDDDTQMSEVDKFYDFWYTFKSWREFPHADEFELDQAESREHKRWMERQNAKLREKAKKEESSRIRVLVDNAYRRDPRVVRRKEGEKAEKLRKRQAKVLAKKEKEEEATRALEEERLRKEEEDRRLAEEAAAHKRIREKEKKLVRKERSRLRTAASAVVANRAYLMREEDIDLLCTSLDLGQLKSLCDSLEGKPTDEQAETVRVAFQAIGGVLSVAPLQHSSNTNGNVAEQKKPKKTMKKSPERTDKPEQPWQKEEVELLRKAVAKYPKGTTQRWETVAAYIGTGRSVEEILKAIKTVLLQKPDSTKAFDTFLEKRKAPKVIESPLSTREQQEAAAAAAASAPANGSSNGSEAANESSEAAPSANESSAAAATAAAAEESEDAWSETQQLALVKALKTFPKDVNQRWERIAAAVPGKNKAQCFKKFAALRDKYKSNK